MGKTILTGLMVGVAAGALTAGFASTANAGAIAYSTLEISNFVVLDSTGTQLSPDDLNLRIGNFTKAESGLNSPIVGDTDAMDVGLQCQDGGSGDCGGIGDNDFTEQPGIQQFSRGDAILTGAAVAPGGANSSTVAEVQLNTDATGTAGANTGTITEFSFALDEDETLTFEFDALGSLHALLEAPDSGDVFAGLGWSLNISRLDGVGDPFSFAPNCLNTSRGLAGPGEQTYTCDDFFTTTTPLLLAGVDYLLSINHESAARATFAEAPQVPEPAAAALLGLGLLGAAAYRRRSHKA